MSEMQYNDEIESLMSERKDMPEKNSENKENLPENDEQNWIPEPSPSFEGSDEPEENKETKMSHVTRVDPVPIPESEERSWAMLAHLSILLNLVSGFLGGVAAIIIYFIYKDRSRLVAYHAMQSFIFQSITWLGAGMLAAFFIGLGSVFSFLILPLLCLIPGFLVMMLIPISLIYGVIGGIKVNNGEDFRYWQVGDWVRDILEPKPVSTP